MKLCTGLAERLLWGIADLTMALINIPVICILGKYVFRALSDYKTQKKVGFDPVFHAKGIGIRDKLDYWD